LEVLMSVAIASPYRYSHTIGTMAHGGRGFSLPVDLAVGRDGRLYVVSRSDPNNGPMGGLRVTVCSIDEDYYGEFAEYGTADGKLIWPTSVAVDSRDNVYVSDEHRNDVQVFGPDRQLRLKFGSPGDGPGQLNRPSGLAIGADDTVFVVDSLNHRVQTFAPDGTPLGTWGRLGSGPGELDLPWGIALDRAGDVYVADWRNDRVQKLTPDGRFLGSYGSRGSGEGQLRRPAGVGVDEDGNVYVADWGNERVQVFAADGRPRATLIGDCVPGKWATEQLLTTPEVLEERASCDLTPERLFWGPIAIDFAPDGRVLILDSCRHRIQVYWRDS
jgi:DNA-binding beta-propeller fold protein YncE